MQTSEERKGWLSRIGESKSGNGCLRNLQAPMPVRRSRRHRSARGRLIGLRSSPSCRLQARVHVHADVCNMNKWSYMVKCSVATERGPTGSSHPGMIKSKTEETTSEHVRQGWLSTRVAASIRIFSRLAIERPSNPCESKKKRRQA